MPISPIFSGYLPVSTPGPYKDIGYAYIRSKPLHPYSIPSPRFTDTKEPVLNIEQIGYALFYPCKPKGHLGVTWFPEPVQAMINGYEKFLGKKGLNWLFKALRFIVGRLRFPAYYNAPLLATTTPYPLVIFSHGLAGTRTTYTQYASSLASQGNVVVVMEHRDGSAPAVTLPSTALGGDKTLTYIKQDDLEWDEEETGSLENFRTKQLEMRCREVYEAYASISKVVRGDDGGEYFAGMQGETRQKWLKEVNGKVNLGHVDLTGHSFGGGTMRVVALDPWLEPLPLPTASSLKVQKCSLPPVLTINSPGFTIWDSHFKRMIGLTKELGGSLVTLLGSNHQSFSDFPLLAPSSPAHALDLLNTINELTASFLRGDLLSEGELKDKKPDQGQFEKSQDGKMAGEKGEVVVHLIGKQS